MQKGAVALTSELGLKVVEVNGVAAIPTEPESVPKPMLQLDPLPTDMVGPGDVLDISIYEVGVTLFAGSGGGSQIGGAGFDPSVKVERLPPTRVDDHGDVTIPYAGRLHVLGKTLSEIQQLIRSSLRGLSQDPQVLVTLREVITNSVIVSGEVAKPGRLVLQTNHETLSDVVALAGGYRGSAKDLVLRLVRRGDVSDMRLSDLLDSPDRDVRTYPGDRLLLISNPRYFSVLGASGRVDQLSFSRPNLSLAEAVAVAGGVNPNLGDPAAIFVFRDGPSSDGIRQAPILYHINMMKPGAYFLSQRFVMRDKDMLYFGNARANQPSKLIQLISQLFTPFVTVTNAVDVLNN